MMNREEFKKRNELLETIDHTIEEALDRSTLERMEWGVATGLDGLLKAKQRIEKKIERKG